MAIENLFSRKKEREKTKVSLEDHAVGRGRARRLEGMFYLGRDLETGDAIFLSDEAREKHMHIVGGSGSGKSSFMESLAFHDLERGRGCVFISGKGDTTTRDALYGFAKFVGREKDFRYFSLIHPEISHRWSPFVRGSATQVKDKLIGSILWSEPYYKKTAEDACQTIMMGVFDAGMRCTFQDLDVFLTEKDSVAHLLERVKNPAGTISNSLILALKKCIKRKKGWIEIGGEEDLAVLPALAYAPLGRTLLYGQPNEGIVWVEVDEKMRKFAKNMIARING